MEKWTSISNTWPSTDCISTRELGNERHNFLDRKLFKIKPIKYLKTLSLSTSPPHAHLIVIIRKNIITNHNLRDVWTWQEMKWNLRIIYEIWRRAEGSFWLKSSPYAFEGVCVNVLSATEREKVGLFLSHPEGWGSCVKSQQLWWLCDWAAPLTCTQIHSPVRVHVHIFTFFFQYTTFFLTARSSVSAYQITAAHSGTCCTGR